MTSSSTLIERLCRADAFPHPVDQVELLETHISWVLLAGEFAYKVKKPLDLGFLDFRTLDSRRRYCDEELRLNRHFAPGLYLEVVKITETATGLRLGGDGNAIDYAVRMRRFRQSAVLDAQLAAGQLSHEDMRELAGRVADWHRSARRTPASRRERTLALAAQLVVDNFAPLEKALSAPAGDDAAALANPDADALRTLRRWTDQQLRALAPVLTQRFDDGRCRECHGDLHLGNLVRLDTGITAFDCIEFDPELRHSDVIADCAFLTMDLTVRGEPALAAEFLNRYLECSGDYDGVRVYALYFVYRCLVRAKIAGLRSEGRDSTQDRDEDLAEARRYLAAAVRHIQPGRPTLIAMHGLSGAGKSYVAHKLMLHLPALRLRSDVERKRMHGLTESASSGSEVGGGLYEASVTSALYTRLNAIAGTLLRAGQSVILDASFLARKVRDDAHALARTCGADYVLCDVVADDSVLCERILTRQQKGDDPSEANLDVLASQRETRDVPGDDEQAYIMRCRSDEAATLLIRRLNDLRDA